MAPAILFGGLFKLGTGGIGHVDHGPAHFRVRVFTAALSRHDALAFQRRVEQTRIALPKPRLPCSGIAELGSTRSTDAVASDALRVVDLQAGSQNLRSRGVFDLEPSDRSDPRLNRLVDMTSLPALGFLPEVT